MSHFLIHFELTTPHDNQMNNPFSLFIYRILFIYLIYNIYSLLELTTMTTE